MAKTSNQKEIIRPKYQQTRLCFSSVPVTKTKSHNTKDDQDYTRKLEKSIQQLNIGHKKKRGQHPDPCQHCEKSIPRVQCTAYKENTNEPCTFSFCADCIEKKTNETLDWIKTNKDGFYFTNGNPIKHRAVLTNSKWACLICRGLCDCESCFHTDKTSTSKLSFNIKPTILIQPPKLNPLDLLYSQEEIWVRLQIREFVFRFGDLYGYDNRITSNLQNVQGDWKVKRFGAYIVCKILVTLSKVTHYELPLQQSEQTIPLIAKRILNQWMSDKDIHRQYLSTNDKHQALLHILYDEGMTGKRWQDIAELLAVAEFQDIPVPTSRDLEAMKTKLRNENDMDIDDNVVDDDEIMEELEKRIRRYQKSSRSVSLLPIEDELKMINMLMELLLFDGDIRQSLNASCIGSKTKEVRDMEIEFKNYKKEYLAEELKHKNKKNMLSTRISQLKVIRGKEEELKQALADLDALETLIRDERMSLELKKLELDTLAAKAQKRMAPVGQDHFGNSYWVFNDLLNHVNNATDYRNSQPYWAYGVIVVGPGFEEEKAEERWWYINGRKDITLLCDWMKQKHLENSNVDLASLANKIYQRVEYLNSLELVVYGEGFFA